MCATQKSWQAEGKWKLVGAQTQNITTKIGENSPLTRIFGTLTYTKSVPSKLTSFRLREWKFWFSTFSVCIHYINTADYFQKLKFTRLVLIWNFVTGHSWSLAGKTTEKQSEIILQTWVLLLKPRAEKHIKQKPILKHCTGFEHMLEESKHLRNICTSAKSFEMEELVGYLESEHYNESLQNN